eukprot:CAMPEP_0203003660 /NCGR_PEP_ID=MMETSP1401-20130829/1957_1 /ASSEMBLY_ACC=CAM_ASM_000894 /TAXON_ID=38833 /ORGANISM="Micromonas pusilla, Strain CCAC1681" /LENGTH=243 /DNA_ID=CAMNT_0049745241 /DNA_START=306 /DNA_END=1034 /DNA_ORIENTATION=-
MTSVTSMTNTEHLHGVFLPSFILLSNANSSSKVRRPTTPASSIVSRAAASSAVSSVSQPPLGKMSESLCLFVTISTSQAPDSARRVGIEPATRRIFASASPANRWRSRPVLETSGEVTGDNGTGLSAEAVEDTLTAPVIPLPSSIVSPRIHRDITVVRVRSALDSRGNPLVIPTRFHAFPRPLQKRRSASHRRGSVGAVASGRRRQCVRARCIARAKARLRARVSHEGSRDTRVFARAIHRAR